MHMDHTAIYYRYPQYWCPPEIGGATMWGSPLTGPLKFKPFHLQSKTNEIFKVGKYKGKMKFEKIWGYQNEGGAPFKQGRQNLNFLTF